MFKTSTLLVITTVLVGFVSSCRKSIPIAAPDKTKTSPVESKPAVLSPVTQNISTNVKGYFQAIPAMYQDTDKRYPLLILFHGGGQFGNGKSNLDTVLAEGTAKLLKNKSFPPSFQSGGINYSFITIIPQFVRMPSNSDVAALVAHIKTKFRVDPSRVYLMGFSLGARMLSNYAATVPTKIAAIASMGGLPEIDGTLDAKCRAMTSARLPIWHVHNRDDRAWRYSEAVDYINKLNGLRPAIAPKFTTFDKGQAALNHDCWTRTMDPGYKEGGKNIYEWLLSYSR